MVPLELRGAGRPEQLWRSLKTADRKRAERAYAATHAEIELLFAQWRKEEEVPSASSSRLAEVAACASTPLTPGLLRRLADTHYLDVYDADFRWRGDLWKRVHDAEKAFWRGDKERSASVHLPAGIIPSLCRVSDPSKRTALVSPSVISLDGSKSFAGSHQQHGDNCKH